MPEVPFCHVPQNWQGPDSRGPPAEVYARRSPAAASVPVPSHLGEKLPATPAPPGLDDPQLLAIEDSKKTPKKSKNPKRRKMRTLFD